MKTSKIMVASAVAAAAVFAQANVTDRDRPQGMHFLNNRLTLRPYVGFSLTYDSNVDSTKHSKSGSMWMINPGFDFDYKDEFWKVKGAGYYQYHAYNDYGSQLNTSAFGETLGVNWSNSPRDEKGWSLVLSETLRYISQDDDMSNSKGRGVGRDRREFTGSGAVERRINRKIRAALMGSYYYLHYDNNVNKYAPLYGWQRATGGGEVAYALTPATEFILHGNYQWYKQDNDRDRVYGGNSRGVSDESKGVSVLVGLGSRATQKITYRALAGWSRFEYGDGIKDSNGFTYQLSSQWRPTETFSVSVLGSSYYQPSEREYSSSIKVYTLGAGCKKAFVGGKLNGTLDLSYRNESHETRTDTTGKYTEDIITGRAGLSYAINQFISLFGSVEYQTDMTSGGGTGAHYYDYDRVRGTFGFRLTY